MSRVAQKPLNQPAVKAADDDFYRNHPEMVDPDGGRQRLDASDPKQARLRTEWMDSYERAGGKTTESQVPRKVNSAVQSCPRMRGVDIRYEYSDRQGVCRAKYDVLLPDRSLIRSGRTDADGEAHIEDLPEEIDAVIFRFHDDPKLVDLWKKPKPHKIKPPEPDYLDKAIRYWEQTKSEATRLIDEHPVVAGTVAGALLPVFPLASAAVYIGPKGREWVWGALEGDFNQDPTVGQIVFGTAITLIPYVDQAGDVRDITANLYLLTWEEKYDEAGPWIGLVGSLIGAIPELGSLLKCVITLTLKRGAKVLKLAELVRHMNSIAKLHGPRWLRTELLEKIPEYSKYVVKKVCDILKDLKEKLVTLLGHLSVKAAERIRQLVKAIDRLLAMAERKVTEVFNKLKKELEEILSKGGRIEEETATRPTRTRGPARRITQEALTAAEKAGMTEKTARAVSNIATENGVLIRYRKTNKHSVPLLERGHPPKPEFLKMKTIGEEDLLVGATKEDLGKVGFFLPTKPDPTKLTPEEFAKAEKRYKMRSEEYAHYQRDIKKLIDEKKVKVEGNVVVDNKTNLAYAGDNDIYDIADLDGNPLNDAKRKEIVEKLKASGAAEHGDHVSWAIDNPDSFDKKMYDGIVKKHETGGEELVEFGPHGWHQENFSNDRIESYPNPN